MTTPRLSRVYHVALVGDSVLDNGAYVGSAPDVAANLRKWLPPPSTVTLCAVDGSTTDDIIDQFRCIPADATDVVLSVGGNDALLNSDLLNLPVRSTAEALDVFRARIDAFANSYTTVVEGLVTLGHSVTVCTIYHGNLGEPDASRAAIAVTMFNDVILRSAVRYGLGAIDLRSVCRKPEDFVNAIEPSAIGGGKIAGAIVSRLEARTM